MREDLNFLQYAKDKGYTPKTKHDSITDAKIVKKGGIPHNSYSFEKGEVHIWFAVYNDPHWRAADLIDGMFQNHRTYNSLKEALDLENSTKPLEWAELWEVMKKEPEAWQLTTQHMYDEMLGALPPQDMCPGAFLVGEPDHHNREGFPVYACFKSAGHGESKAFEARYMTQQEFNGLKGVRS